MSRCIEANDVRFPPRAQYNHYMDFLLPLWAALLQAGSFTLDKFILSVRRVSAPTYVGISFPFGFLVLLAIFLIFHPPLPASHFSGNLLLLLLASIGMLIGSNIIFYRALKSDLLGEIQIIDLSRNIPIIIFSSIIFADERNFGVLIPALIASLVIMWSHWEKHHFIIARKTVPFLIWSLAAEPIRAVVSKMLLVHWNPISLELVRAAGMTLVFAPFFLTHIRRISTKNMLFMFLTAILTSVAWVLFYFSFQRSGIVYTILLFSLQPLLTYLASLFLLKERVQWKKAVAFVVVLLAITAAQIMR